MLKATHFHSHAALYRHFEQSKVYQTASCLIHPHIETTKFASSASLSHQVCHSALTLWKKQTIARITAMLDKDHDCLFAAIARKDLLSQQIFQLFVDVGFKAEHLALVFDQKRPILEKILASISRHRPTLEIDPEKDLHLFGYSFDLPLLSMLLFATRDIDVHLWLVDHQAYPAWIQPEQEIKPYFFKPLNQWTYANKTQGLAFLFATLADIPKDVRVGIMVNNPLQRAWLHNQFILREIPSINLDDLESSVAPVQIGSLQQLALSSFDTVYIFDFWFHHRSSSSLWSKQERAALHKNGIVLYDHYCLHRLMDVLAKQSESMYVIFHQQTTVPFLFFHPDEQADPLPTSKHAQTQPSVLQPMIEQHRSVVDAPTWPDSETTLAPLQRADPHIRLSPTSLTQISRCPRQFYFQHLLKAPQKQQEGLLFAQNPKDFGMMMHQFLQDVVQNDQPGSDFAQVFDNQKNKVLQTYAKYISEDYRDIWRQEMQLYFDSLQTYLQQEHASHWQMHRVEYSWQDDGHYFADLCSHPNLQITWSGQIDRVDQDQNSLRLIDYKTGKITKKKTDLFEGGKFIQMPLYVHYMAAKYPDKQVQAEIHQISATGVASKALITHQDYQHHKQALAELIAQLIQPIVQGEYRPNPGKQQEHCRSCSYIDLCGPYLQESLQNKEAQ